jgi:transposase-like protein
MGALLAGQGVHEVAAEYKLPTSTVSRWKAQARAEAGKSDDVGELLLGYLRENLTTLRAQAVAFRNPAWLAEQEAGAVAVLHGVMTDKAVRLLEALEGSPVVPSSNGHPNRVRRHV